MALLGRQVQGPDRRVVSEGRRQVPTRGKEASPRHTCTNSTGALSPSGLATESLVAGKAFGATVRDVRLRGFVTTNEDMVTASKQASSG